MSDKRIRSIDAIRGLCVVLMVAYHFGFTLNYFGLLDVSVLRNAAFDILEPLFAGTFILICGVCSRFSRSNIRRGLLCALCAALVSIATFIVGAPVRFGILHFLAFCMLVYGLFSKTGIYRKFNDLRGRAFNAALAVSAVLAAVCFSVFPTLNGGDFTAWLGIGYFSEGSADWFPALRWFFVFITGTLLGKPIKDGKFPRAFYEFDVPLLPAIGRHALIIYVAHQPVFFGILYIILRRINS